VFILDTDIVSNLRKIKPHPRLLTWIEAIGWQDLSTSVLTIMEIQIGIERTRRSDPAAAERIQGWLSEILQAGAPQIIALEIDAALILGRMRETPALRNFFVGEPGARAAKTGADLGIAAIAIARGAVVATNNEGDFLTINRHFALPGVFNPLEGRWVVQPVDALKG
jgi:predicted nucleic acid-binding protein